MTLVDHERCAGRMANQLTRLCCASDHCPAKLCSQNRLLLLPKIRQALLSRERKATMATMAAMAVSGTKPN